MQSQAIRYDLLVQDALRGMVRELLAKVARECLPGDHHFFVTFKTQAPGVQLSARMKARYPDEITIVLQHQFWDLTVSERQFEVGLSFSNIPERLVVPFSALTGFHDPSVPFMLKFEPKEAAAAQEQSTEATPSLPRLATKTDAAKIDAGKTDAGKTDGKTDSIKPAAAKRSNVDAKADAPATDKPSDKQPEAVSAGAAEPSKVVSIDAFRKKT
jgi:hypothetical protein